MINATCHRAVVVENSHRLFRSLEEFLLGCFLLGQSLRAPSFKLFCVITTVSLVIAMRAGRVDLWCTVPTVYSLVECVGSAAWRCRGCRNGFFGLKAWFIIQGGLEVWISDHALKVFRRNLETLRLEEASQQGGVRCRQFQMLGCCPLLDFFVCECHFLFLYQPVGLFLLQKFVDVRFVQGPGGAVVPVKQVTQSFTTEFHHVSFRFQ